MSMDLKVALVGAALIGLLAYGHFILKRLDRIIALLARRRD